MLKKNDKVNWKATTSLGITMYSIFTGWALSHWKEKLNTEIKPIEADRIIKIMWIGNNIFNECKKQ